MAIITIGGNLGAGKSTLAPKIAAALGYTELYVGGIFRELAAERKMTIEQFYAELKNDPALERSVDDRQAQLMKDKDDQVIQGRVAWFFAKGSPFKVVNIFLAVEPQIGAERVSRRKENEGKSIEEVAQATAARTETERDRYALLYKIKDYFAPEHYDILLDTSHLDEAEVFDEILKRLRHFSIF